MQASSHGLVRRVEKFDFISGYKRLLISGKLHCLNRFELLTRDHFLFLIFLNLLLGLLIGFRAGIAKDPILTL